MITLIKYGALGGGEKYNANIMYIDGLSGDTKPTGTFEGTPIPNASVYTEIDTGKEYTYDSVGAQWYETTTSGGGGGGGGTTNYAALSNKPQINGITLSGNKTSADLGLQGALTQTQLGAVNSGVTANSMNVLEDILDSGEKNMIFNGCQSYTSGSFTCTVNANGSITLNGTVPNTMSFLFTNLFTGAKTIDGAYDNVLHFPQGNYRIATSSREADVYLQIIAYNTSSSVSALSLTDVGDGSKSFTVDNTYAYNFARIRIIAGKSFSNFTFMPFVCTEDAWLVSKTVTPYRMTTDEITSALNGKQNIIDSSHKLSADNVDDTNTTNKFATAAELAQIETNKNNILKLENEKPFNDVSSTTNQKVIDAISDFKINVLDTSKTVKLVQVFKNYNNVYVITFSIDGVNYHALNKASSGYTEVAYNAFSFAGVCNGYVIIDWDALDNNTMYGNINSELKQKYKDRYIEYETPKYKNVDLLLPSTVNVAVGKEISLEYFNIIKCSNINDYVITFSSNSAQIQDYGDRLRIAPTEAKTTSETVRIMYNGVELVKKTFSIKSVADTKPTIKAIFIGDSFTDAAIYLSELVNLLGTDKITLYGTRTTSAKDSADNTRTIYHEGRAGWSTSDYTTKSSSGGVSNPFYNGGFDFSYYITNNPTFSDVTDVFVELGLNDGAGTNFETRYAAICGSIKAYNSNIRVHCLLPTPPCHDGRGFGSRNNISYNTFKDYMFNLCTKIKTLYDNTAGYFVVPTHANLNCWYDFPQVQAAVNSRNPEQITVLDDNVHPQKYGYYRYADVVYSDIIANCQ